MTQGQGYFQNYKLREELKRVARSISNTVLLSFDSTLAVYDLRFSAYSNFE